MLDITDHSLTSQTRSKGSGVSAVRFIGTVASVMSLGGNKAIG